MVRLERVWDLDEDSRVYKQQAPSERMSVAEALLFLLQEVLPHEIKFLGGPTNFIYVDIMKESGPHGYCFIFSEGDCAATMARARFFWAIVQFVRKNTFKVEGSRENVVRTSLLYLLGARPQLEPELFSMGVQDIVSIWEKGEKAGITFISATRTYL